MDVNLAHTSISGKKITSFARAIIEIFEFLLDRDFWTTLYNGGDEVL